MEGTTFVLLILFLFVLPITLFGIFTGHRKEMMKMNAKLGSSEIDNVKNELEAVKARLEVVEAIVTDKQYQLNQELASLKES
jgi:Na+-transporting methylmalonyl-CoA/oxaloacetate decarboxylase gamma subunit